MDRRGGRLTSPRPVSHWQKRFPGRSFITVDGVELHYERQGKGPPVLLLHGLGDSHATWRGCLPLLAAKGFDVIAVDLKGSGYSEKPLRSDYSTAGLVEEIGHFLDALKIRRAAIVGVSYGGHLALRFATLHPRRVSALIVADALAYSEPMNRPLDLQLARLPGLGRIAHWFMSHRALMKTYRRWNFSAAYDGAERVAEHWRFLSLPGGRKAYLKLINGIDERLLRASESEHGSIKAPTLLLWGDSDAWFPVAQGERLAKAIRGARLVVIKGGSHLFMEESPALFIQHAAPFLKRILKQRACVPRQAKRARGEAARHPPGRGKRLPRGPFTISR